MRLAPIVLLIVFTTGCGLDLPCSPRSISPTGVLSRDLLGSWEEEGAGWTYTFYRDGQLRLRMTGGSEEMIIRADAQDTYRGTWSVSGDRVCMVWGAGRGDPDCPKAAFTDSAMTLDSYPGFVFEPVTCPFTF